MQYVTKLKLAAVHQLCMVQGKSTEYMLQLMQDTCAVNLSTCVSYMRFHSEHKALFNQVNQLTAVMSKLENHV
jgi:hypothetical protein